MKKPKDTKKISVEEFKEFSGGLFKAIRDRINKRTF